MLNRRFLLWLFLMSLFPSYVLGNQEISKDESKSIQDIVQIVERSIRAEAEKGFARRGAHAKAHGCVKAQFRVLPLPNELSLGMFSEVREYPAWIRFSNGADKVQDDSAGDGRGMAIKLMHVDRSPSGTQDFVMLNHPTFFVKNAADYVEFQKAIATDSPIKFFFPDPNPLHFRLHELGIVMAIRSKKVNNPLDIQYWSTTPYRFGVTAMKFSTRPCNRAKPALATDTSSANYLRQNMQEHLDRDDACFDFMIQLRKRATEMPVEDPTIEWSEKDSPFITVAKITIPAQRFDTPEQQKFCEDLAFSPWHAIPEHEPLGGINRVRKAVYEASSRIRQDLNRAFERESAGF